ncbi:NEDD4-binding protein 2 [Aplochiton taeniatus]
MPRKKKNGQSPARVPGSSTDTSNSAGSYAGYRHGSNVSAPASNFPSSNTTMVTSDRDVIVRNMQEMFSHLDPEVIYIVLAECDFKVDNAMDSLLELSVAAEGIAPLPPCVSGFELTAAALLSPNPKEPRSDLVTSTGLPPTLRHPSPLTEEYDLLIDHELETLASKQEASAASGGLFWSSSSSSAMATPSSSLPSAPLPQHSLPELLQTSLGAAAQGASKRQASTSGGRSPLDELSLIQGQQQQQKISLPDFCHLTTGRSGGGMSNSPLDLAAAGRPSAFQAYKKQGQSTTSKGADRVVPPGGIVGGARAKANVFTQEPLNNLSWNTEAPVFTPRVQGNTNRGPAFITPVALNPSQWNNQTRPASQWLGQSHVNQAPLKPFATIPKSWALPASPHAPPVCDRLRMEGKVLVLLRGAPGSGKSTLARALLGQNPGGVILSTDDYFSRNGKYLFEASALGEAHEWNHGRAKAAFESAASPVIIDNTNSQSWEMKPYVAQALRYRYKVLFREPDTWWKNKPRELERRTKHAVPVERIRRMLDNFERYVSIQSITGSQAPESKQRRSSEDDTSHDRPMSSDMAQPDLVGEPGLAKVLEKSRPQLYCSLPDVSSVATSGELGMPGQSGQDFESLISRAPENHNITKSPNIPDDDDDGLDFGELDLELDSQLELGYSFGDQGIPDCIVESVLNEGHHGDEATPVAFSESIGQRVRTERRSRKTDFMERLEPADLVREADQSERKGDGAEGNSQGNHCAEASQPIDESHASEVSDDKWSLTGALAEDGGHVGEVAQSPVCEGGVEVEGSHLSGGSQERKRRQSRRSGKSCKLAFTFTQNCPSSSSSSSPKALSERPQAAAIDVPLAPNTEVNPNLDCQPCFDPKLNFDPNAAPSPNAAGLEPRPPPPLVVSGLSTQTDPLDFALLWRLDRRDQGNNNNNSSSSSSNNGSGDQPNPADKESREATVLLGNPARFLPELSGAVSAAVALHPADQKEVPYRVAHEKGSQVEEADLGGAQSRLQDLRVLSRHFKLVSFDTLEDLYDQCQQDLEWTTNLLLDSGERLFRDEGGDDDDDAAASGEDADRDLIAFVRYGGLGLALGAGLASSAPSERPSAPVHTGEAQAGASSGAEVQPRAPARGRVSSSVAGDSEGGSPGVPGLGRPRRRTDVGWGDRGALSQPASANEEAAEPGLGAEGKPPATPRSGLESGAVRAEVAGSEVAKQDAMPTETPEEEAELGGDDEEEYEEPWSGEEPSNVEEMTQSLLSQLEEIERRGQREKRKGEEEERRERREREKRRNHHMDIQSVELKLPTELAIQLTELFGPVGIDPGACSSDDYAVRMDLNLAKLLHQKWKDTIQEGQRQAALSFHFLQESSVHWGESQSSKAGSSEGSRAAHFLIGADAFAGLGSQSEAQNEVPLMDHWNTSRPHVSLRNIMTEEQALQETMEKSRLSRRDVDQRDGASLLKERQLYSLFPTIDRHFLLDIFKDYSYNLVETEQFLSSLLDGGPAKTVVAPEPPQTDTHRTPSKEREKRRKPADTVPSQYQDVEDPEYGDFRAEARVQRARQQENFTKAADAHRQGQKDVASFYAQQGHLHGQKMREAHHRAAVQIFERVNASLLPQNVLDLHGLHVDEARQHLAEVLLDKTNEFAQGLCSSKLSVITGRGNHSQGGVARIRPAVIEYLTSQHYRFTEPKMGLVLVSLS